MIIQRILLILLFLCIGMVYAETPETITSYLIVVESTPPELFEKGQILESEAAIQLSNGQSVTLISSDGKVFTLIGTDSGVPIRQVDNSDESKFVLEKALSLLSNAPFSIVRSVDSQLPEVWMANIANGGKYCSQTNTIKLWRDNADKLEILVIKFYPRGKPQRINWVANQDVYTFTFQDGVTYLIKLVNKSFQKFTFYQMPAEIQFIPQKVSWMAKHGCKEQAMRCFPYNHSECR